MRERDGASSPSGRRCRWQDGVLWAMDRAGAQSGGVGLDRKVAEADGGEGVEGEVEGVEVRPVVVVEPEGHRVASLLEGKGLGRAATVQG